MTGASPYSLALRTLGLLFSPLLSNVCHKIIGKLSGTEIGAKMRQMPLLYDRKRDVFEGVWSKYRFFVPQNRRSKSGGCQSLTYSQLIMNAQTPETPSSRPDRSPNTGGRPRKPLCERRDHVVKVGFDRLNYAKLKQLQQREGKSLSGLVYEFAVNGYVKEALP